MEIYLVILCLLYFRSLTGRAAVSKTVSYLRSSRSGSAKYGSVVEQQTRLPKEQVPYGVQVQLLSDPPDISVGIPLKTWSGL